MQYKSKAIPSYNISNYTLKIENVIRIINSALLIVLGTASGTLHVQKQPLCSKSCMLVGPEHARLDMKQKTKALYFSMNMFTRTSQTNTNAIYNISTSWS